MTYTPLNRVIKCLLDEGFNATEDDSQTLKEPIEANATAYKKGQCKS